MPADNDWFGPPIALEDAPADNDWFGSPIIPGESEENPLEMGFPLEQGGFIQDVKDTISIPGGSALHSIAQRTGLAEGDPAETQAAADRSMAEVKRGHGAVYNTGVEVAAVIAESYLLMGLGRGMKAVQGLSKARTASAIGSNYIKRAAARLKTGGMQAIIADYGTKVYAESLNRTNGDHAFALKQTAWELWPMIAMGGLDLGGAEDWFLKRGKKVPKSFSGAIGKMASVMAQEVPE